VALSCRAADDGSLRVAWLNALVCEVGVHRMPFSRFEVQIDAGELQAVAFGEPVSVARHRPAVEVKGVTRSPHCVARKVARRVPLICVKG